MTTITVTPELLKQLNGLNGPLEFRDEQGRLIAAYSPTDIDEEYINPIDGSPFREEEVRRLSERSLEGIQGRSLKDILCDLETRQ